MKRWWLGLLLLPVPAFAQLVNCTQYRVHSASAWVTEEGAACSAEAARCDAANTCGGAYNSTSVITESTVPTPLNCRIRYQNPPDPTLYTYSVGIITRTGMYCEPPPEEECENDIGDSQWQVSTEPISGSKWCQGLCEVTAGASDCSGPPGLQTCTTLAKVTGTQCEAGEGPEDPGEDPPAGSEKDGDTGPPDELPEKCTSVGDGEYCKSPSGDGKCGYMNDTYICLDRVQEDECVGLRDGGRVCSDKADTTPPVPDSGTPGDLADPDGQMSNSPDAGTTNNYHYYNSGTVGASSRDPGTTGAAPTGGSPGYQPQGSSSGGGTGGDGECVGGETCGENLPVLEDVGTMAGAFAGFWSDLQAVPIVAAGADVAPSFGSGSCPSWSESVNVNGQAINVSFNSICTTYSDISPALTIVALVLWGFLAFRILWSA